MQYIKYDIAPQERGAMRLESSMFLEEVLCNKTEGKRKNYPDFTIFI